MGAIAGVRALSSRKYDCPSNITPLEQGGPYTYSSIVLVIAHLSMSMVPVKGGEGGGPGGGKLKNKKFAGPSAQGVLDLEQGPLSLFFG